MPASPAQRSATTVIIGAGQAGLAMSRCLTQRSIDHVLLERGDVANSWDTERWDSLRLLTPNWMTRLPGFAYQGDDQEGFMGAGDVAALLRRYRSSIAAPVESHTVVEQVCSTADGFTVDTDNGPWSARSVVVATGAHSTPRIPAVASALPGHLRQLAPMDYRNPDQLDEGPVLVVGASASGVQLADELVRSGRDVTLAVGEHVRAPRTYRGMDIHWWMSAIGLHTERYDDVDDVVRARRTPSLQLIGSPERREVDLNTLRANGVQLAGRLVGCNGSTAQFSGSLANVCASADLKADRLLARCDAHVLANGLTEEVGDIERPARTALGDPVLDVDLGRFATVIWATGFRPSYPWLDPELLDRKGAIVHRGGVMSHPGMYVLGLPFQRRRNSSFIDGVGADALDLSAHLHTNALASSGAPPRRSP